MHGLTFADPLGANPLSASDDRVQFFFDTDGVEATFERTLTVDGAPDGSLKAEMTDSSGSVVGEAVVTTDGATLAVNFRRGLLGRSIDAYRWMALAHDGSSQECRKTPCDDRAPDTELITHRP